MLVFLQRPVLPIGTEGDCAWGVCHDFAWLVQGGSAFEAPRRLWLIGIVKYGCAMDAVAFSSIDHIVNVAKALETASDGCVMYAVLAFSHCQHTMLRGFPNDGEDCIEVAPHQVAVLFGNVCDCGIARFEPGVIVARIFYDMRRKKAPFHLMALLKAEIIQKCKCIHGNLKIVVNAIG